MPDSAVNRNDDFLETAPPQRVQDVLNAGIRTLRDRLPTTWAMETRREAARGRGKRVDAEIRLRAPDGEEATVLVEAKRLLNTRDVGNALEQLNAYAGGLDDPVVVPMLAARYLAPATQERIAQAGAGYVDATGNLLLVAERPALFLRDRGADRDPWRSRGRPRDTLQGPPAAQVVRALIDFAPPYSVPELGRRAKASTGVVYRVVELLEQEGLLERERYGQIRKVAWRELLERWSADYGFARSNTVQTFLEPRGLPALMGRLAEQPQLQYAVTGSLAAERVAPYAPARLATVYVLDIADAAAALALRPAETGANVALAAGTYDVVFERIDEVDGLRFAALSQVAVDLLTGPGRNPSEGSALLEWMAANESDWRR